ncbi:MAG: ABC transporter ATP-binding protein [Anaerolineae bacterium]
MSEAEFTIEQSWRSNRSSAGRWIASHALKYKFVILGVLVGAIGNAALAAVVPILIGEAFDAIKAQPPLLDSLRRVTWILIISQVIRGLLLQMARNIFSETLGQRLERDIRDELYVSLVGKSMSFHDSHPTGDLMARATNDVREVNMMFNPGFNLVIGSANFILMPLVVAPSIHPQLILTPLIYLAAYGFVVRHYLSELRPAAEEVRHQFGEVNANLAEAIEGIETVKGAAQEEHEADRFEESINTWRSAYVRQAEIEARFLPLLLLGLLQAGGLLHSLLLMRTGAIAIKDVIAFNGLLLLFGFPTWTAQFAYSRVASGMASARRLLELITARTELGQNVAGYDAPMRGAVTLENVSFCYDAPEESCDLEQESLTLEDIDFQVEPGQTVAIVGQTGTGKSTIAKLINRIYDVDAGRVLIDGVDVRDWNLEALRRQISIIEQDIFLFSRSIEENIAFGNADATHEEVVEAAKAAQAHDFILGFKEGYGTVIGERGTTLSGGQRQRLALARAFLTNPAILILDDATSAIDSETEDRIQRAIERAAANRTTFLITHRLSQIRWADLILVMRQGRLVARGTHEDLMETSKAYRDIFARYE